MTIDILKKANQQVTTSDGEKFYPVTTTRAVYFDVTDTLYDLLTQEYKEENPTFKNGIFKWLSHLQEELKKYAFVNDLEIANKKIEAIETSVKKNESDIQNLTAQLNHAVTQLAKKVLELKQLIEENKQ